MRAKFEMIQSEKKIHKCRQRFGKFAPSIAQWLGGLDGMAGNVCLRPGSVRLQGIYCLDQHLPSYQIYGVLRRALSAHMF